MLVPRHGKEKKESRINDRPETPVTILAGNLEHGVDTLLAITVPDVSGHMVCARLS